MRLSMPIILAPLAVFALPPDDYMSPLAERQSPTSIDRLFKARGKLYIGVSTDNGTLQQGKTAAIIRNNFGQVTPEYSMKWDALEPARNRFTFGNADFLVNWARQNGAKTIHGHTLLWHRALPAWVSVIRDKATLAVVVETHIKAVVGRYKGKVRSWDVVNEAFNDDGSLRSSVFSRVLGEAYIGIAFRAARAADPDAKLYINDYNLDRADWAKVVAIVSKVNQWLGQGIPIDGIGSQTHLAQNMAGNVLGALQKLASARVTEIAITELDITGAPPNEYANVVSACLSVPKCRGITVWGVSDKNSWISTATPLLFDVNYEPKPAYNAIVTRLRQK
ncbi:glycosyl hydrolase family 10 [Colletotrichum higginsianum]|uniref:Beta-xylanase n=3 Tax=Colletotrichum higginsianum TaxID=80884 RepID=H1VI16_COLHI|nr:Endo-1,4-beta-xylanase [Colletotrichum higginsianum]CCF39869.1 glycosyl hydrolase family 10 [Colletotrichum higginsianum]